jgi:hypothetical protein
LPLDISIQRFLFRDLHCSAVPSFSCAINQILCSFKFRYLSLYVVKLFFFSFSSLPVNRFLNFLYLFLSSFYVVKIVGFFCVSVSSFLSFCSSSFLLRC